MSAATTLKNTITYEVDLNKIPPAELREASSEIQREIGMRTAVYPGLIKKGELTQETADRRQQLLRLAGRILGNLASIAHDADRELTEPSLFPRS